MADQKPKTSKTKKPDDPKSRERIKLLPPDASKRNVEFTPHRKILFLEYYKRTGLLYQAAEAAGVSSHTVADHRKRDPVFDELVSEAKEAHTDSLVGEAVRRAVEGVPEPIIGGKDRDTIVTHVQKYSDRLLELLLRSRRREFQNREAVEGGSSGGVLIVQPAQQSITDWQAQYGEAAKGQTGTPKNG